MKIELPALERVMDLATGVYDFCAKAAGPSSKSTLLISALYRG
jgi:hypothetical protein